MVLTYNVKIISLLLRLELHRFPWLYNNISKSLWHVLLWCISQGTISLSLSGAVGNPPVRSMHQRPCRRLSSSISHQVLLCSLGLLCTFKSAFPIRLHSLEICRHESMYRGAFLTRVWFSSECQGPSVT